MSTLVLATAASGATAAEVATGSADSPAAHAGRTIAVGTPNLDLPGAKHTGGVDVYFHDGGSQRVTEQSLGLVASGQGAYDRFGASVVVLSLNGDAYPDLVIGAPGRPAKGAKGKVVLAF